MSNQLSIFGEATQAAPTLKPYTGKIIYETRGKAREYNALSANLYRGCDHGCIYCYAPSVLQKDRGEFHASVTPRPGIVQLLEVDAKGYARSGQSPSVLLCFTCDPYHTGDTTVTRQAIQVLHKHGLSVTVLTKGGTRALRDIDLFSTRDTFACTLTCLDDTISRHWEPKGALPGDRLAALKAFHSNGIPTWVSLEPVLDPEVTLEIIRVAAPYVDEFKVGVLNYYPNKIDWGKFAHDAVALLESLGKEYYVKEDLRKWLNRG